MNYFNSSLKFLEKLIKIPSVEGVPQENAPFGKDVANALSLFLEEAQRLGFQVKNYDGYAGEVIFGNPEATPENCVGVLAHLDVVPEGEGWSVPPYALTEQGEYLLGRGVLDDKGPAAVTLYAMKKLLDEGFTPSKTVKLILGCNEETGWRCMDYYTAHAKMPERGFSPDAEFPVIYAERGILHARFAFPLPKGITSFTAGERANMVPAKAQAKVSGEISPNVLEKHGVKGVDGLLQAEGVQAHGSTPWEGKNACVPLLNLLLDAGLNLGAIPVFFADEKGISQTADETGNSSFSPNVVRVSGNTLLVTVDIRYAPSKRTEVVDKLNAYGVPYEILHEQPPLLQPVNGELIQTLLGVYNHFTGETASPIAIGGGTYARAMKNGVAFGPCFLSEPSTAHQADEKIKKAHLYCAYQMYGEAIKRLSK